MRVRYSRTAHIVVAATLASVTMTTPPATAAGSGGLLCELRYPMGIGVTTGTGVCNYVGSVNSWVRLHEPVYLNFTVNEPVGITCMLTGSASGTMSGGLNVSFNWTRVGSNGVVTTSGEITGVGPVKFFVKYPIGNPCGGPTTQHAVFGMAGL